MSRPANTNATPERRKRPMTQIDIDAVRAVYASYIDAHRRLSAAEEAKEVCEHAVQSFRSRAARAIELATRGQIMPANASLVIVEAEQAALRVKPLAAVDRSLAPVLTHEDADRARAHLHRVDSRVVEPEPTKPTREEIDYYDVLSQPNEPDDLDAA